ncbi:MAG: alpha/beta fold hydrolase [Candidatus Aminicenantes bacterium]|jgi:alpha-beta hydrolase superfamily lysophospholipase
MQKFLFPIGGIFLLLFTLISVQCGKDPAPTPNEKIDAHVVLLHGLRQSRKSMEAIEDRLILQGYSVINVDYPSTDHTIEYLASVILDDLLEPYIQNSQTQIHFVTHSMGGIIVRYYLEHHNLPNLGRVVMVSPPNQGSELVDLLKDQVVLKRIYGPAAAQLSLDEGSLVRNLGPADFELGVIAGSLSFNPLYSALLPGPDDGVVTIESMKLEGMDDFIILPLTHGFILRNDNTIAQVLHFLEHGVFLREE